MYLEDFKGSAKNVEWVDDYNGRDLAGSEDWMEILKIFLY